MEFLVGCGVDVLFELVGFLLAGWLAVDTHTDDVDDGMLSYMGRDDPPTNQTKERRE